MHTPKLALSGGLVAFGTTKLLAQLFLLDWEVATSGQSSDIVARGDFLLGLFLPLMALVGAFASVIAVLAVTRRGTLSLTKRLGAGFIGSVGSVPLLLGLDPTAAVLRTFPWSTSHAYFAASALVGLGAGLAGLALAVRHPYARGSSAGRLTTCREHRGRGPRVEGSTVRLALVSVASCVIPSNRAGEADAGCEQV